MWMGSGEEWGGGHFLRWRFGRFFLVGIYSNLSLVDVAATLWWLAGGGPAATHFSLLRQRKVSKRKAAASRCPSGSRCCGAKIGKRNELAALRHVSFLIRFRHRNSGSVPSGFHVKIKSNFNGKFKRHFNVKTTTTSLQWQRQNSA